MLKLTRSFLKQEVTIQPPSGGCVLKRSNTVCQLPIFAQPPSGGCVLKLRQSYRHMMPHCPAAFGRLCVETKISNIKHNMLFSSRLRAAVC